jgi:electron transport complex protein RnfB
VKLPTQAASTLAQQLLDALPQTQCTRCGYPDCAAYAQAIAAGEAPINQCPPGGSEGIARLAAITGHPVVPLNPAFGTEAPRWVAFIDESWCIGCTLCIKACPTDAIVGSSKRMHTVLEPYCTGCALCLPVCPVDCIATETVSGAHTGWDAWSPAQANQARARYQSRTERIGRETRERPQAQQAKAERKLADLAAHSQLTDPAVLDKKRSIIEAALAKARQRQHPPPSAPTPPKP